MVEDKQYMVTLMELKKFERLIVRDFDAIFSHVPEFLKSKTPIEPNDDAIETVVEAMTHITQKVIKNKYITDLEVLEYAKALLTKLNIPEIEEVIGKYQATVLSLNKVNAEKVKLQHQLDNIPEQKTFNEAEIREILSKMGVYCGTIPQVDIDNAIKELSTLTPKAQEMIAEGIVELNEGGDIYIGDYWIGEITEFEGQIIRITKGEK